MTANPSLIDTLAQKLHEDRRSRDGLILPWGECAPEARKAAKDDVASVLRSLVGPGQQGAMLAAILTYAENQTDMDDEDGPDEAKCLAWDIAQGMTAALRAALEETGNV